jgi:hypothetical protein
MIRNNEPNEGLTLSPAYLAIECNNGYPNTPGYCNVNEGCNEGDPYPAIFFASQYGIPPDQGWNYYDSTLYNCSQNFNQSYPGDVCNYNYNGPTFPLYYPEGVIYLSKNGPLSDQQIIQDLLCYGPLVAAGFLAGSNGSNSSQIAPDSGHAMLLVGYDNQSQLCQEVYGTSDCWIFENQWGNITGCIVFTTNGVPALGPDNLSLCGELYQNYQNCNNYLQSVFNTTEVACGGVYWMQDGYMYVPFDQSPYGLTFPYYVIAIQNVTLSQ